jgi:ribonuclease HI
MPTLTCASCATTFTPDPALVTRYPGWTPRECPSCYAASRRSSTTKTKRSASSSGSGRGSRPGGSTGSGRNGGREEHLTIEQVLARYHGGPDDGVFTDGSSIPNPGPGGWGAVYVRDGEVVAQDHDYDPDTTNNRMELRALQAALELVEPGTPVRIYTDSNLAVKTLTEWAPGWRKRGWKRKTGPVENLDLVKPLFEAFEARPEVELVWIKAHAGNRWNEYADALATAWAREQL